MIAKHPGGCKPHPYQDTRYGKDFRVMNPAKVARGQEEQYRCTVCGPPKEHSKRRLGLFRRSELVVHPSVR